MIEGIAGVSLQTPSFDPTGDDCCKVLTSVARFPIPFYILGIYCSIYDRGSIYVYM